MSHVTYHELLIIVFVEQPLALYGSTKYSVKVFEVCIPLIFQISCDILAHTPLLCIWECTAGLQKITQNTKPFLRQLQLPQKSVPSGECIKIN